MDLVWKFPGPSMPEVRRAREIIAALRRNDNGRGIERYLRGLRDRLRRPGLIKALRRPRQPAVGRRLDFETAVARLMTGARIVMSDVRREIDVAAAIDRGLHMHVLGEAPVAFDDGIRCIDAVND